jgi:hypothetical protein
MDSNAILYEVQQLYNVSKPPNSEPSRWAAIDRVTRRWQRPNARGDSEEAYLAVSAVGIRWKKCSGKILFTWLSARWQSPPADLQPFANWN